MKIKITIGNFAQLNIKKVKELLTKASSSGSEGITLETCGYFTYENPEDRPYIEIKHADPDDPSEQRTFIAAGADRAAIKYAIDWQKDIARTNLLEARNLPKIFR